MKFVSVIAFGLVVAIAFSGLVAWPFMIAVGNLHAVWGFVPALGFFDVWSVTWALSVGIALMRVDWSE